MENGAKFMNGDLRKNSLDEEPTVPVLVNGEGEEIDGEGDEGSKSPVALVGRPPSCRTHLRIVSNVRPGD